MIANGSKCILVKYKTAYQSWWINVAAIDGPMEWNIPNYRLEQKLKIYSNQPSTVFCFYLPDYLLYDVFGISLTWKQ